MSHVSTHVPAPGTHGPSTRARGAARRSPRQLRESSWRGTLACALRSSRFMDLTLIASNSPWNEPTHQPLTERRALVVGATFEILDDRGNGVRELPVVDSSTGGSAPEVG